MFRPPECRRASRLTEVDGCHTPRSAMKPREHARCGFRRSPIRGAERHSGAGADGWARVLHRNDLERLEAAAPAAAQTAEIVPNEQPR